MRISNWPRLERPREKLLERGAANLSDAELLAVVLQTGIKGKNSLELARELIVQFGGLSGIMAASHRELCVQTGVGLAKAARIVAMKALSERQMLEGIKRERVLTSSAKTREYLRARFRFHQSEIFSCLFLNNQHQIVKLEELFRGTIDGASVPLAIAPTHSPTKHFGH